jgi:hypothetical protein
LLPSAILATQEAEIRGITVQSWFQENSGDSISWGKRGTVTKEGWWSGSGGKSACLASMRPCIQTYPPKKKRKCLRII